MWKVLHLTSASGPGSGQGTHAATKVRPWRSATKRATFFTPG